MFLVKKNVPLRKQNVEQINDGVRLVVAKNKEENDTTTSLSIYVLMTHFHPEECAIVCWGCEALELVIY